MSDVCVCLGKMAAHLRLADRDNSRQPSTKGHPARALTLERYIPAMPADIPNCATRGNC